MKFFRIKNATVAFTGTSRDYITREAVERANDALIGRNGNKYNQEASADVYSRYNIERPTSKQISDAATTAMRMARLAKAI